MSDKMELAKMLSKKRDAVRIGRTREDFGEMMERLMKEKGMSSKTLSPASNLSDRTIRRMKGDDMYEPTREMVIAVCVGMKLTYDESLDLIHKSAFRLRNDSPIDAVYLEILRDEGRHTVTQWNAALALMGAKLLGGGGKSGLRQTD